MFFYVCSWVIGSFSNDDDHGNEDVKKAKGLLRKTTTFHGVLLKAGSAPQPTARDGPAARRPSSPEARWPIPDFPQFFCPAVNPRACKDLHRVRACKIDDGELEFIYHLII